MGLNDFWTQADGIGKAVAYLLLAMSLASWLIILWKGFLLARAGKRFRSAKLAFWQQSDMSEGVNAANALDQGGVAATLAQAAINASGAAQGLAAKKTVADRLTASLRDALGIVSHRLNFGQVMLASIGSTAPFVGLFGTVWGIYHALTSIGQAGQFSIDKVAGPVGEALIMTAAGLAVAIPAVLAYNIYGKIIRGIEADCEGFAHDLRALMMAEAEKK
jgi:biopolymer transport protein ExbB